VKEELVNLQKNIKDKGFSTNAAVREYLHKEKINQKRSYDDKEKDNNKKRPLGSRFINLLQNRRDNDGDDNNNNNNGFDTYETFLSRAMKRIANSADDAIFIERNSLKQREALRRISVEWWDNMSDKWIHIDTAEYQEEQHDDEQQEQQDSSSSTTNTGGVICMIDATTDIEKDEDNKIMDNIKNNDNIIFDHTNYTRKSILFNLEDSDDDDNDNNSNNNKENDNSNIMELVLIAPTSKLTITTEKEKGEEGDHGNNEQKEKKEENIKNDNIKINNIRETFLGNKNFVTHAALRHYIQQYQNSKEIKHNDNKKNYKSNEKEESLLNNNTSNDESFLYKRNSVTQVKYLRRCSIGYWDNMSQRWKDTSGLFVEYHCYDNNDDKNCDNDVHH